MSPKYVALIFIREFVMFSALSCLPAGPSLSPLSRASPSPGAAALGSEGAGFPIPSPPPPQIGEQEATRGLLQGLCRLPQLPKLGPPFGGEWRLLRRRGGRTESGRALPARPWRGKDPCDVHLVPRLRSERAGALSPRSPRPPVGGALVMHYSSPSRPPARAAAASLAFPARAPGCAEERERGAFTILWQLRE